MRSIIRLIFIFSFFVTMESVLIAQSLGGKRFIFRLGEKEWSEPLTTDLKDNSGKKVPVSIRIKFKKRFGIACHYTAEVTNLDEKKSVSVKLGTGYSDYKGNAVVSKFKLKPKAKKEGKLIYGPNSGFKKPENCLDAGWSLKFYDGKIK
jgi:hypothetical protein